MSTCSHDRPRDLVDRITRAVADNDPATLEILLTVLEAVADAPMLARLDAAMGRSVPGPRRPEGGASTPLR